MTEDEAKEKSCPFYRVVSNMERVQRNNAAPIYSHAMCKASECIMWRTKTTAYARQGESAFTEIHHKIEGFCGLAGRP